MTKDELIAFVKTLLNDYYITVGLLRYVADCELEKLHKNIKEYRVTGNWRMWINKAYKHSEETSVCKWLQKYNAEYDLYQRTLLKVPTEINTQLLFIKVVVRNYVINATKVMHDIKSDLIFTLILYEMVVKLHLSFVQGSTEKHGKMIGGVLKRTLEQFTLADVVPPLQAAVYSFFDNIPKLPIANAEQAMLNKLSNVDWINRIIHDAMVEKGGYEKVLEEFDKEENERELQEIGIDKLLEKYSK